MSDSDQGELVRQDFRGLSINGFLSLLILIAVVMGLLMLVDLTDTDSGWAELFAVTVTALCAATLVLALHISGAKRSIQVIAAVIGAGTVATNIVWFLSGGSSVLSGVLWLGLVVATPVIVIHRVAQHEVVTTETLLGAICAYVLIGLAYTFLFIAIDSSGSPFFGEPVESTAFAYFSLVTMTTLGYGDLSPASELARLASASEAVVGQVFLVIGVARLVSLYTGKRRRTRDED